VLIVAGDSPLLQVGSIRRLLDEFVAGNYACLLGTLIKDNPTGLGRIVRNSEGVFERIVEEKDASPQEKQIREVNMSTYLFQARDLLSALDKLENSNAQGEFYLTDCPALLRRSGAKVDAKPVLAACEALSINTIDELDAVEAKMLQMGYSCVN
jgi:bifunctional UDP-N-acetylglucosamine pyrophosphorylase/glucosamine-1-phosphate N-acetyltransferase/UDP-N-acetylglucosamine pyrophosphorylase